MEYDLVFEGGGAKGMVFVGAMQEFEERGHTCRRLLGTSAGAITAALLAAGYTAKEMLDALGEKENGHSVFSTFMAVPGPYTKAQALKSATLQFLQDVDIPLIPGFLERQLKEIIVETLAVDPKLACSYSFLEYGGVYSADHFVNWMQRRLDSGENRGKPRKYSAMTLEEFFNETQVELTLVASDTTGNAMLVLNHCTAPRLPLVWAVRMSMSIPLLWQEVIWVQDWGTYRGREMTGHAIVDGGLLSNFPIELFVSQDAYVKKLMGSDPGQGVLGMLIDENLPVAGAAEPVLASSPTSILGAPTVKRIANLVNTMTSAHDKLVSENFDDMVVRLPAHGYGTTEFEMKDDRRSLLVQAGCDTMRAYFEQHPAPAGVPRGAPRGPAAGVSSEAARQADRVALRILER